MMERRSREGAGITAIFVTKKRLERKRGVTGEKRLKFWETIRDDEAQGVSEYAVLLVLLVLIIVATVHALGANAQQVIDRVNVALHG